MTRKHRTAISPLQRISCLVFLTGCRVSAWAVGIRRALITAPDGVLLTAPLRCGLRKNIPERHVTSRELCSITIGRWASRGSGLVMADGEVVKSVKPGPLKEENVFLRTGVSMQTIYQKPSTGSAKRSKALPPLVFIHGSFHGAWCWAEHWMPFLSGKGYDTYSISLRGTSGTSIPGQDDTNDVKDVKDVKGVKVKISDHVSDVRSFAETVLPGLRPVFIAHSFGGMVLLKLMEELDAESQSETGGGGIETTMAGGVFLCSTPPFGNGPMTKRFMKERPLMVVKLILGFVLKMAVFWPWLARDLFFSNALEQSTLKRYMSHFQNDSKNTLDLLDLRDKLPSKKADTDGRASWARRAPPRFVVGAERDRIVDEVGIQEMATFLDTEYTMLPTVPHEVMLGPDWPLGADRLLQWLEATDFTESS